MIQGDEPAAGRLRQYHRPEGGEAATRSSQSGRYGVHPHRLGAVLQGSHKGDFSPGPERRRVPDQARRAHRRQRHAHVREAPADRVEPKFQVFPVHMPAIADRGIYIIENLAKSGADEFVVVIPPLNISSPPLRAARACGVRAAARVDIAIATTIRRARNMTQRRGPHPTGRALRAIALCRDRACPAALSLRPRPTRELRQLDARLSIQQAQQGVYLQFHRCRSCAVRGVGRASDPFAPQPNVGIAPPPQDYNELQRQREQREQRIKDLTAEPTGRARPGARGAEAAVASSAWEMGLGRVGRSEIRVELVHGNADA